jgi:hypothetical protein
MILTQADEGNSAAHTPQDWQKGLAERNNLVQMSLSSSLALSAISAVGKQQIAEAEIWKLPTC